MKYLASKGKLNFMTCELTISYIMKDLNVTSKNNMEN